MKKTALVNEFEKTVDSLFINKNIDLNKYILFRDRISATAIVSFILWLICLMISFFVFCIV